MSPRTGVLIFEGGQTDRPAGSAQAILAGIREQTTLDTAEKFSRRPEVDVVVLATDSPRLAGRAKEVGAEAHRTEADGFRFGQTLRDLVARYRLDRVVYLGGGSVPLLGSPEIAALLGTVTPGGRVFVANNAQSPDLVGLASAEAVEILGRLRTDNATLFALADAGYERRLLPETAAVTFDLDTPTDVLFLAWGARRGFVRSGLGPRCAEELRRLDLDIAPIARAAGVLAESYPAVTLVGRVSGSIVNYLNERLLLRLRVFSEERGMKALGRLERGEVRSLLGAVARDSGIEYLVRELALLSDAVFWDTRVIMAHLAGWPDEADRFEADLGRWEKVRHPDLRRLCRAAGEAGRPFVLGGHSVVAGGLRLLVEGIGGGPHQARD